MAIEYRVSWTMWPCLWSEPRSTTRITANEKSAKDQYEGLLLMLAKHELRPCDKHIWKPKLECRIVETEAWELVESAAKEQTP